MIRTCILVRSSGSTFHPYKGVAWDIFCKYSKLRHMLKDVIHDYAVIGQVRLLHPSLLTMSDSQMTGSGSQLLTHGVSAPPNATYWAAVYGKPLIQSHQIIHWCGAQCTFRKSARVKLIGHLYYVLMYAALMCYCRINQPTNMVVLKGLAKSGHMLVGTRCSLFLGSSCALQEAKCFAGIVSTVRSMDWSRSARIVTQHLRLATGKGNYSQKNESSNFVKFTLLKCHINWHRSIQTQLSQNTKSFDAKVCLLNHIIMLQQPYTQKSKKNYKSQIPLLFWHVSFCWWQLQWLEED